MPARKHSEQGVGKVVDSRESMFMHNQLSLLEPCTQFLLRFCVARLEEVDRKALHPGVSLCEPQVERWAPHRLHAFVLRNCTTDNNPRPFTNLIQNHIEKLTADIIEIDIYAVWYQRSQGPLDVIGLVINGTIETKFFG